MRHVPDTIDYDMYAKMDYWNFAEAIWLAVSYKLSQRTYACGGDYSSAYDEEFSRLARILYRSIELDALGECAVIYGVLTDGLPILSKSYVTPYWFVEWISKKGYGLPVELKEIKLSEVGMKDIEYKFNHEAVEYIRSIGCESDNAEVVAESDVVICSKIEETDNNRYRFEKVGKSWNLQFEDEVLIGVKNWVGMSYIKLLLQNHGQRIFVLKMLELPGESGSKPGNQDYVDTKVCEASGIPAWEESDRQAINEYKKRLAVIEEQLKSARTGAVYNKSKVERLEKEKSKIEPHLKAAGYEGKDPVVEKARKSVSNAIDDAIANISKLEGMSNYNDKPISRHLKRYIKKGATCSYLAEGDNLPSWKL